MTRPVLELVCHCSHHGHPGTTDYSSAPCPHECWQPGRDASVRLRGADLTVTSDYEAALDEHGIACPHCDGVGGGYVDAYDGYRWLACTWCEGRGVLLPYECPADCDEAVEWIRARAQDGDDYAADWLLAWQRPTEPAPAGEEAAE